MLFLGCNGRRRAVLRVFGGGMVFASDELLRQVHPSFLFDAVFTGLLSLSLLSLPNKHREFFFLAVFFLVVFFLYFVFFSGDDFKIQRGV